MVTELNHTPYIDQYPGREQMMRNLMALNEKEFRALRAAINYYSTQLGLAPAELRPALEKLRIRIKNETMHIAIVYRTDLKEGKDLPLEKIELRHLKGTVRDIAPAIMLMQSHEFRVLKDDNIIIKHSGGGTAPHISDKALEILEGCLGTEGEGSVITGKPDEILKHPFHLAIA